MGSCLIGQTLTRKTQKQQILLTHLPKCTWIKKAREVTFCFTYGFLFANSIRRVLRLLSWTSSAHLHASLTLIFWFLSWDEWIFSGMRNIHESRQREWKPPVNIMGQLPSLCNFIWDQCQAKKPSGMILPQWSTHFIFLFLCFIGHCKLTCIMALKLQIDLTSSCPCWQRKI